MPTLSKETWLTVGVGQGSSSIPTHKRIRDPSVSNNTGPVHLGCRQSQTIHDLPLELRKELSDCSRRINTKLRADIMWSLSMKSLISIVVFVGKLV
jgi:hypothetical protein